VRPSSLMVRAQRRLQPTLPSVLIGIDERAPEAIRSVSPSVFDQAPVPPALPSAARTLSRPTSRREFWRGARDLPLRSNLPAVKIAGAPPTSSTRTPLESIESVCDDILQVVPDSCLSLTEKRTMPFPETCPSLVASSSVAADATASLMSAGSAASAAADAAAAVSTDESGEDSDLGDFLLDAVNWL